MNVSRLQEVVVAFRDELLPGECKVVEVSTRRFALFNVEGRFYLSENTCPHKGGPLGDGFLCDRIVRCPWHAWRFDVVTGRAVDGQEYTLRTFATRLEGEHVMAKLDV